MKKDFEGLLQEIPSINISNTFLYHWDDCYKLLISFKKDVYTKHDFDIVPFYVCSQKRLELYDFELNVRCVNDSERMKHAQLKSGRSNLDQISPLIMNKIENTYIEINEFDQVKLGEKLIEYFAYVKDSQEIAERVENYLGTYKSSNIYFEYY